MLTLHYASYFRCMHNSTHTCQPVLNGAKQAVLVYRGNASAREDKYEKEKKNANVNTLFPSVFALCVSLIWDRM